MAIDPKKIGTGDRVRFKSYEGVKTDWLTVTRVEHITGRSDFHGNGTLIYVDHSHSNAWDSGYLIEHERAKNPHMLLTALDPPRKDPPRRWRCRYCSAEGLHDALAEIECTYVYEPCEYCSQAPYCALDCPGIAKALAGEDVYIAGLPPPKGEPS